MYSGGIGISLLLLAAGVVLAIFGVTTIGIALAVIGGIGLAATMVTGFGGANGHASSSHTETVVVKD